MKTTRMGLIVPMLAVICLAAALLYINTRDKWNHEKPDPMALSKLPVRQLAYWKQDFARPLLDRIHAPDQDVLKYLHADNLEQGFPDDPVASRDPNAVQKIRDALSGLPAPVLKALDKKLAAILVVEHLGSTGISDIIYTNGPGTPAVGGFISLDLSVLTKNANQWATWRDESPFWHGSTTLQTIIAEQQDDTPKTATQYILLHEFAHILAIGLNIHPNWEMLPQEGSPEEYPFTAMSWRVKRERYRHAKKFGDVEMPKVVRYYAQPRDLTPDEAILPSYESLENSPFVNLYATTSPFEDFAETFVTYVHSQIMHRPYETLIFHEGQLVKTFKLCFGEDRCDEKLRFIRNFYDGLSK